MNETQLPISGLFMVISLLYIAPLVLTQTPCPVGPPCDCDGRSINCDKRGLTEIPHFNVTNGTNWWVDFNTNNITVIPPRAFANLKGMYYMKLSENAIVSIADDAFDGSEDTLNFVVMSNNQLKKLPTALSKMKAITSLSVADNPLRDLDPEVLKAISPTLQYLTFGSQEMTEWPTSIQFLTNLTSLSLYDSPIETLPTYAFLGLQKVGLLEIQNCGVSSIPVTLNMMTSLNVLSITNDPNLYLSGFPSVAFSGLQHLGTLWINNQNYSTLPDIFHDATSLQGLEINSTPIKYFDAKLIPDNPAMTSINFNGTLLDEIPSAITKMKRMRQLILRYNSIKQVRSTDFKGFNNLTFLGIISSPLSDIADDAFSDLDSLQFLVLDNTNITTVPKAISRLRNPRSLRNVSLQENKLVCDCESLDWMKTWIGVNTTQVFGDCVNRQNMSMWEFIRSELPKCQ